MLEELSKKYSKKVFEFCIYNSAYFNCIPINGKVVCINGKYYVKTNTLRKNHDEFDLFELEENPTKEELNNFKRMEKYPQHVYVNLLQYKDDYEVILLYSKKSDKDANDEIDYMTYDYFLKYNEIDTEKKFLKQIKKSVSFYNQNHPNNHTSLSKVLKMK